MDYSMDFSPPAAESDKAADWLKQQAQPAVLATLFRLQLPQIYAMRKNGQLPVSPTATYAEALPHYIGYLQKRANAKDVEGQEKLTAAQTANLQARTQKTELEIAAARRELVQLDQVAIALEAAFIVLRDTVTSLARQYPEAGKDLLAAFNDLADYGQQVVQSNEAEYDSLFNVGAGD